MARDGRASPRGLGRPHGAEAERLAAADSSARQWRDWGPYVAERAWGTVREDYSADGDAWASFPFEQAVSRAYRWNEDGLSAFCDSRQRLCVGIALWNGQDPVLKERYFGLSGPQGNHGEDAKDYWWYLDATPTHSYHRTRYAYPLAAFPYDELIRVNGQRDRMDDEYELIDTDVFGISGDGRDAGEYVMVTSEWAKASPGDLCLTVDVHNRADHEAAVHVLPTLWFRNTWSWDVPAPERPRLWEDGESIRGAHPTLGAFVARSDAQGPTERLWCENESNARLLYGADTWAGQPATPYPKDGINDYVLHGAATVNPAREGTKAAFHHLLTIPAGGHAVVRFRLTFGAGSVTGEHFAAGVDDVTAARRADADEYWQSILGGLDADRAQIARQALAGLLSSKQYYPYGVARWLAGDPGQPSPPPEHATLRNANWTHLAADDVILMPDPWEYPWFASWDLAFHSMALALIDPAEAKRQLLLLLGERYMHPNGAIPAYEWNFSDTNPPVHAWAALQVFQLDGGKDLVFLRRVMHQLLAHVTWWVNRKDAEGNDLFEGGFLGLDNIGAFDRSAAMPAGEIDEQSDGTAWMAMYCLDLLRMALTLARVDHTYDDLAVKFLLHFCSISAAAEDLGLWDEEDGFFYDQLRSPDGQRTPVKIRSVVGLIPLAAVTTLDGPLLGAIPVLEQHLDAAAADRPELTRAVHQAGRGEPMLLAMAGPDQVRALLGAALDPAEFLSDFGLRSLSARHRDDPAEVLVNGETVRVDYEPAESRTPLFGGNSNWRGPIWFPTNVLLISALRRYHSGTPMAVEYPTGGGEQRTLAAIADDLSERLLRLFLPGADGRRPCQAGLPWQQDVLFHEYFNGDTGAGLGASHQTGWTALIALLIAGEPG